VLLRARSTRTPGGFRQRAKIVLRWPIGLTAITFRYVWRLTPVYRVDEPGGPDDLPPPLPEGVEREGLQLPDEGYGTLLHRRYAVRIEGAQVSPEDAVTHLAVDPNHATPVDAAVFVKTAGEPGEMRVGDEYVVRMPGPWDGPVRVVDRTPTSFRFATLQGHLEAS
jgi:hypothetical protein